MPLCVTVNSGVVLGATQFTSGSTNSAKESVFVGLVPARLLETRQDQTTVDVRVNPTGVAFLTATIFGSPTAVRTACPKSDQADPDGALSPL